MKYFIAIALIAAVASASPLRPTVVSGDLAEIGQIIAAINHPSTDPATAAVLEQMLMEALGISELHPIHVGPAIVEPAPVLPVSPVVTLPALVPEPVNIVDVMPVLDGQTPAAVGSAPASASLVQIIVNINAAAVEAEAEAEAPAGVWTPEVVAQPAPTPVNVVDSAPVLVPEPVVLPESPTPVVIVDEPVLVVDNVPEPIIVAEPAFPPTPVVILPDILN